MARAFVNFVLATHGDGPPVYGVLFGGIFVSVIGFGAYLRWISHKDDQKNKK